MGSSSSPLSPSKRGLAVGAAAVGLQGMPHERAVCSEQVLVPIGCSISVYLITPLNGLHCFTVGISCGMTVSVWGNDPISNSLSFKHIGSKLVGSYPFIQGKKGSINKPQQKPINLGLTLYCFLCGNYHESYQ